MNWKEQLEKYEDSKNWKSAMELIQRVMNENPSDVEVYIRAIYLLHNVLIEENYAEIEHSQIADLLKKYFDKSYEKFSDNAEYLFFIGKILYVAEWYFGVDDDLKPVEEKQAFHMQKRAFEKEPDNALYEWAYRFSLGEKSTEYLAEQILINDNVKMEWIKAKGFPGRYIWESLKQSRSKH